MVWPKEDFPFEIRPIAQIISQFEEFEHSVS